MEMKCREEQNYGKEKTLYNYYSSKKIYLACTPSKLVLLEKKKTKPVLSLVSRNTVIINTKNGMLLFPSTK